MAIVGAFMVPHPPLIVEEVGQGREKEISSTIEAYKEVARRIAALKPETIILTSPHSIMYADYFHISPGTSAEGDLRKFGAGNVRIKVQYDREFTDRLSQVLKKQDFSAGTLGEREKELDHATMVPLYFINQKCSDYKLVRIGLSGQSYLDHYKIGEYIKKVSEEMNRRVVFVASGDLSHKLSDDGPYGFQKEGPEYDARIMEAMGSGNFMDLLRFDEPFCDNAAECGHRSFIMMAGALDKTCVKSERLSYEGPFGVGYGICGYEVEGQDDSRDFGNQFRIELQTRIKERKAAEDPYVRLARQSLESYVKKKKITDKPSGLPEEMIMKRAGTFVSIKKNGQLRGCIGTTAPTRDSVADEIIHNAISAGTQDPRFDPITVDELEELVYSVDVLGETEPIVSKDELDVKRFGVIVTKGRKRGLLLPNLEGVDTIDEQISISKKKAGIGETEEVTLERFEVIRHY